MNSDQIMGRKIAIIGAGSVGATTAYAIMLRGLADEIVLVDKQVEKARAEALDMRHGLQFAPAAAIRTGDTADAAGSAIIIITAGAKQKPGQSRLDLAAANKRMLAELVPALVTAAPQAILLMVTNPVDVLTHIALEVSGLPARQVFGTGTVLDSSRFRHLIAEHLRIAVNNVHAYIVGEHGDSEVPLWSSASVGNVPLDELRIPGHPALGECDRARVFEEVRTAAQQIIAAKGATNWAIGLASARVVEAILRDENAVLPVSRLLEDYHGIGGVCLSVPSVVSRAGVGPALPLQLSDGELHLLRRSAELLKETRLSIATGAVGKSS